MLKVAMLYGQETGVEYYRLLQPAKWINRLSLCEVKPFSLAKKMPIMRKDKKNSDDICLEEIGEWADIFVSSRIADLQNHAMLQGLARTYNKPVIMELDDDVTCIDRDHPGYQHLKKKNAADIAERIRIKSSDLEDYKKRGRVLDTAPVDNHPDEVIILYMKGIDAEWVAMAQAECATALTVTTESIRQSYSNVNKNIYILKNCIDFEVWDNLQPAPKHDKIRIGWAGGMQHNKDIDIIVPVVARILAKYPNVEFHYSNCMSRKMTDLMEQNKDRITKYEWVNVKSWPQAYTNYAFDIALAPVTSTKFNKGKSNLKWLENSACKIPTVASRWDTYSSIVDGVTGFLAETQDEWVEKVSKLVESEQLRRDMGQAAYDEVKANYNAEKNAYEYARVYNEIKYDYKGVDYGISNTIEKSNETAECGITC